MHPYAFRLKLDHQLQVLLFVQDQQLPIMQVPTPHAGMYDKDKDGEGWGKRTKAVNPVGGMQQPLSRLQQERAKRPEHRIASWTRPPAMLPLVPCQTNSTNIGNLDDLPTDAIPLRRPQELDGFPLFGWRQPPPPPPPVPLTGHVSSPQPAAKAPLHREASQESRKEQARSRASHL